jgi:hypothetical protein
MIAKSRLLLGLRGLLVFGRWLVFYRRPVKMKPALLAQIVAAEVLSSEALFVLGNQK